MTHIVEGIDISSLLKARDRFERFRKNLIDDQAKLGAIHALKVVYELAWKTMKRIIQTRGIECGFPKDMFPKAEVEGLIDNKQLWFDLQTTRNLTDYAYEQEFLDKVVESFDSFSKTLNDFIERLKTLK